MKTNHYSTSTLLSSKRNFITDDRFVDDDCDEEDLKMGDNTKNTIHIICRTCFLFSLFHIGLAVRVFANDPGELGSIPGRVIPKTQKMVLDDTLFNTQHYKVRMKGKVEQSRVRSSALLYTLV